MNNLEQLLSLLGGLDGEGGRNLRDEPVLSVMAPELPFVRARTLWLHKVSEELRPEFEKRGHKYPSRMSIEAVMAHPLLEALGGGFTSGSTLNTPKRGWVQSMIKSGMNMNSPEGEAYVKKYHNTPEDFEAEVRIRANIPVGIGAAGTLIHELAHAVLPPWVNHGPEWAELVQSLGLEGKDVGDNPQTEEDAKADVLILSASNSGHEATKMLRPILERVGEYPKAPPGFDVSIGQYIEVNGLVNAIQQGIVVLN